MPIIAVHLYEDEFSGIIGYGFYFKSLREDQSFLNILDVKSKFSKKMYNYWLYRKYI